MQIGYEELQLKDLGIGGGLLSGPCQDFLSCCILIRLWPVIENESALIRPATPNNFISNYHDNYSSEAYPLQPNTFEVLPKRKRIIMFKAAGAWIFKHFFDDREIFQELADHYNKDLYRFEFKTVGGRNKAIKLLEMRGFDVDLVEDLRGYAVKLPKYSRYAAVLKNSVAVIETPEWRIFLMKDLAAVEEAQRQGAKIVEVDVKF